MGVRDTIAKAIMGIKAYHSSPHDFDKFDLKKIGTGEGAQVYGHGLYFAENPAVSGQGGQYWNQFLQHPNVPPMERAAAIALKQSKFDRDAAIAAAKADLEYMQQRYDALPAGIRDNPKARGLPTREALEGRQRELELLTSGAPVGPRTYEVNIKANPAQFLDWDKPIKEQPVFASAAGSRNGLLRDVLSRTDTGENLYKALSYDTGLWKKGSEATKILAGEGIPGIKYLDEGSRGPSQQISTLQAQLQKPGWLPDTRAGLQSQLDELLKKPAPTSNYVVFDPDKIDILKKYGVVGAPAGALGATYDQSQYEVQP